MEHADSRVVQRKLHPFHVECEIVKPLSDFFRGLGNTFRKEISDSVSVRNFSIKDIKASGRPKPIFKSFSSSL